MGDGTLTQAEYTRLASGPASVHDHRANERNARRDPRAPLEAYQHQEGPSFGTRKPATFDRVGSETRDPNYPCRSPPLPLLTHSIPGSG
jgi:hypothetical protein